MMLDVLPYDVLAAVFAHLRPQSLLAAACSCRALRAVVTPKLLFARVIFSESTAPHQLASFAGHVRADPLAAHAVRHLEFCLPKGVHPAKNAPPPLVLFGDAMAALRELRSIVLSGVDHLFRMKMPLLASLASQKHLQSITLRDCSVESLIFLRHIVNLRYISISMSPTETPVCSQPYIKDLLLGSRSTLQVLRLDSVGIDLDFLSSPSSSRYSGQDLVWPRVHTLDLAVYLPKARAREPNFAHAFPAARRFSSPLSDDDWAAAPHNAPFIAHIASIETTCRVMNATITSGGGGALRRVVIRNATTCEVLDMRDYIPRSLRHLTLTTGNDLSPVCFAQLADVAPDLRFLHAILFSKDVNANPMKRFHTLVDSISTLRLEYVAVTWYMLGYTANFIKEHHARCAGPYVEQLGRLIPTLRIVSLRWFSLRKDYRRVEEVDAHGAVTSRFVELPLEEGLEAESYYDSRCDSESCY
ncbi:hypothetical protein BOTBODRAFT_61868 [Botryobasidium botryosum FD-172 SS1]|uniref:F-box domain-containing protein n=1 Tax=Botryobasidium botryosum (strain FD-172 SS1) TaxID=930990 RepID=A0A067MYF4_BOTB1|nr:hypothetical protein BOTBODRAFT_61868 [Botryobasidium botryosum FD-172 SS1]